MWEGEAMQEAVVLGCGNLTGPGRKRLELGAAKKTKDWGHRSEPVILHAISPWSVCQLQSCPCVGCEQEQGANEVTRNLIHLVVRDVRGWISGPANAEGVSVETLEILSMNKGKAEIDQPWSDYTPICLSENEILSGRNHHPELLYFFIHNVWHSKK